MSLESGNISETNEQLCNLLTETIIQSCEHFCQEAFLSNTISFPGQNGTDAHVEKFEKVTDIFNFSVECALTPEEQILLRDPNWWAFFRNVLGEKGIHVGMKNPYTLMLLPVVRRKSRVYEIPQRIAKTIAPATLETKPILWE